jgi:hypothetical protein
VPPFAESGCGRRKIFPKWRRRGRHLVIGSRNWARKRRSPPIDQAIEPKMPYVLALAAHADGSGELQSLAAFTGNAAGAAIVDTTGPIRQLIQSEGDAPRRYPVLAAGTVDHIAKLVQVQAP